MLETEQMESKEIVPITGETALKQSESDLIQQVIDAKDAKELQAQLSLFNENQTKKNILRLTRLSGVLDQVDSQLIERLEKRPDQIPTKDIIEIMNAVSNQIERINNFNAKLGEASKPTITAVNKTEINVNMTPQLNQEERAGVMDAVASLLKQLRQDTPPALTTYPDITEENTDSINAVEPTIVYTTEENILNTEE